MENVNKSDNKVFSGNCKIMAIAIFFSLALLVAILIICLDLYDILNEKVKNIATSTEQGSSLYCFSNETLVNRNWPVEEDRNHIGFGNVSEGGREGLLYCVFRGGYQHGVALNEGNIHYNLGGKLFYSVSYDYGVSWSDPICFMEPNESLDLRDPSIWWDSLFDCYYLTYSEKSNDGSTCKVYLLKYSSDDGLCSFDDFIECALPYDDMPVFNASYSQVVRVGTRLYLPVYGHGNNKGDRYYAELLIGNATGTEWEVMKSWNAEEPDNSTECTFFTTFNENGSLRFNVIFRGGNADPDHMYDLDIAHISYSDDGGATWSEKISLGFDVAGGPRVSDVNGVKVLTCRDQSTDTNGVSVLVAYFSADGLNWNERMIIADDGPGYASLINNGNTGVLYYFKEYGNYCNLYSRKLRSLPSIDKRGK